MKHVQLKSALKSASLHALLLIVSKALSRSGYGDVQFLDRRSERQKSRFGGHELICEMRLGPRVIRVVVKVVRDSVRIRHLDELAGTIIRMGADSGLIVSPHHLTGRARQLLESYGPVRVGVIDGDSLAAWLGDLHLAVDGKGQVDFAYFGHLEEMASRAQAFLASVPA